MDEREVWRTIDEQRADLADVLAGLADEQWQVPSLCSGWRVQEVAAHLTLAHMGPGAAAVALVRARGGFDRMIDQTARAQARRLPPQALPGMIRAMVGSRRRAPGVTPLEPLLDVLVHGQDVAVPLGLDRPVPAAAAAAAADRVWARTWPFHARRRFAGLRLVATDADWSAGDGAEVAGPVRGLLLLVTGRAAALPLLHGEGAATLAERLPASAVRLAQP